jgi:hypothetical protein
MNYKPKRNRGGLSPYQIMFAESPQLHFANTSILSAAKRQEMLQNDWVDFDEDGESVA